MKRKVCEVILIIVFYVLQTTFFKAISIAGISANIMIILPVVFGYFNGKREGIFVGLISGLMYDIYYSSVFGFSSLVFMYAGYVSGIFHRDFDTTRIIIPMVLTAVSDFTYEFLMYIGNFLLHNKLNVTFYLRRIIIPELIYTLIVFALMFRMLEYLNKKFKPKERKSVQESA